MAFHSVWTKETCACDTVAEKKREERVSVVVSVSAVVLSSEEESCINAFLFSVVALFRSIDDDEEF